jgi:two-component system cell cycle sensor histidine kinase/response regulator CckA
MPSNEELQNELNELRREVSRLKAVDAARRGAEEALARSEIFGQALLRSLPAHIAVLDKEGSIVGVNSAWERFARETGEATLVGGAIGSNYLAHCRAAERENSENAIQCADGLQAVLDGSQDNFDLIYPSDVEGRHQWWLMRAVPVAHSSGGVVLAHLDVTKQRESEEALAENLASFRLLFSNHPHPMWVYDAETLCFLEVNDAALNRYGYTRDEFMEMGILDLRLPEDRPKLLELLSRERPVLQTAGEWRHVTKAGEVMDVEIVSHRLVFSGRKAVLVMAENVTEQKLLQQKVMQSQKMDIVGRLASGLAHDFNNSLTAIMGFTGLAELELPIDHPAATHIQGIQTAATGAANLLQQLLAFARRQSIEPRVIDLNGLLVDVDHLLRHLVGEHIEIVAVPSPELGRVQADPGQLKQVLVNLADNARRSMPTGGRLLLETDNVTLDETYARQHVAVVPGEYVRLSVTDNGKGFSEEVKSHIFEPFFMATETGEDTGLGLATCYGIIKQSGGYIWVYSEVGKGTTFRIYLPRVDEPASTDVDRPRTPETSQRGNETVLVVDDEPLVRSIAIQTLRALGYTVMEASNGREAFRLAKNHPGRIDLLLTDTIMPLMGGPELARRLKTARPKMRVLFTSGYTGTMLTDQGTLESGSWFISKPFTFAALAAKVREVLEAEPEITGT